MKVAIHHDGKEGFVSYNSGNQEIMVTHPDERVRNTVRHYLTHKRHFTIPGSNNLHEVGNRKIVELAPIQNPMSMAMGLCEMSHHTGVHVNWGHEDNRLKELSEGIEDPKVETNPDPNAKADKPIVKSMDGNDYEIIN